MNSSSGKTAQRRRKSDGDYGNRWFDRKFELGLESDAAAELLQRLRRVPDRLAEAVRGVSPAVLTHRSGGKWSIQENAGHLLDLEPLWEQRLDDYDAGSSELHPADLEIARRTKPAITIAPSQTFWPTSKLSVLASWKGSAG